MGPSFQFVPNLLNYLERSFHGETGQNCLPNSELLPFDTVSGRGREKLSLPVLSKLWGVVVWGLGSKPLIPQGAACAKADCRVSKLSAVSGGIDFEKTASVHTSTTESKHPGDT